MPKNQASDDCALIKTKNNNLLINNDSLVENVHFNDITICPQDLGWKAVVSNLSDLLSSGSKKTLGITISLILPSKTEWVWIEELYKGMNRALKAYGGIILGGDCSRGNQKMISITAFGYVVDGFDVLEELTKDDKITSIDVLDGIENLKLNA